MKIKRRKERLDGEEIESGTAEYMGKMIKKAMSKEEVELMMVILLGFT